MPDNEKILQLIVDCQSFLRSQLVEVIQADANAETIRSFTESLQCLSNAFASMSESSGMHGHAPPLHHSDLIREIAKEQIADLFGRKLDALSDRIERALDKAEKPMIQQVQRNHDG